MRKRANRARRRTAAALCILAAALAMTAGCAPRSYYMCENGRSLEVIFREHQGRIEVDTGQGTFYLRPVPATSGTRYADEERVFWFKGDELAITVQDRPVYGTCRKVSGTTR